MPLALCAMSINHKRAVLVFLVQENVTDRLNMSHHRDGPDSGDKT